VLCVGTILQAELTQPRGQLMPQKGLQAWQPFLPADFAGGVQ